MMCLKGMNLSKSSKALVCPIILFIILVTPLVPKQIVQPGAFGAQGQLLQDAMALQGAGGGAALLDKAHTLPASSKH